MDKRWFTLDAEAARMHPLYGVKGWLPLFALGWLFKIGLVASAHGEIAHASGLAMWDHRLLKTALGGSILAAYAIALTSTALVVTTMYLKKPYFRRVASLAIVLNFPLEIAALKLTHVPIADGGMLKEFVTWVVLGSAWLLYLLRSERVRVTFEHLARLPERSASPSHPQAPDSASQKTLAPPVIQHPSSPPSVPGRAGVAGFDEDIWSAALAELDSSSRKPGLWAKVYAESQGEERPARACYLKLRFQQMCDEKANASSAAKHESPASFGRTNSRSENTGPDDLKRRFLVGQRLSNGELTTLVESAIVDPTVILLVNGKTGDTPLHVCIERGMLKESKVLIGCGASKVVKNLRGHRAIENASMAMVMRLQS